jgi:hypothetical protein
MLKFKTPSSLLYDGTVIKEADSLITLDSNVDANYIGSLQLTNKVTKILHFVKQGKNYKARLMLREEDINYLIGSNFKLKVFNSSFTVDTLPIQLNYNLEEVNLTVKKFISRDFQEIMVNMLKLENKINDIIDRGFLKGIKILNPELTQKGMVPVAIDDKGNYIPQYPFANIIKEINGLQAVNEKLSLTAADINLKEKDLSVQETLTELSNAIKQQGRLIKNIAKITNQLSNELKETKLKLAEHLNSGII